MISVGCSHLELMHRLDHFLCKQPEVITTCYLGAQMLLGDGARL